jgi:putative transcriptional regulator
MPIVVNLDVMLARRKMHSRELAERTSITGQCVLLKSGQGPGTTQSTLPDLYGSDEQWVVSQDAGMREAACIACHCLPASGPAR